MYHFKQKNIHDNPPLRGVRSPFYSNQTKDTCNPGPLTLSSQNMINDIEEPKDTLQQLILTPVPRYINTSCNFWKAERHASYNSYGKTELIDKKGVFSIIKRINGGDIKREKFAVDTLPRGPRMGWERGPSPLFFSFPRIKQFLEGNLYGM